jgi:hypothetical protein
MLVVNKHKHAWLMLIFLQKVLGSYEIFEEKQVSTEQFNIFSGCRIFLIFLVRRLYVVFSSIPGWLWILGCYRLCIRHQYLAAFSFGEERIGLTCWMASYIHITSRSKSSKPKETEKSSPDRSHILIILPTLPLHSFFVRYQNSEFPSSLESLWNLLLPWYSEFPLALLLLSPNSEVDKSLPSV